MATWLPQVPPGISPLVYSLCVAVAVLVVGIAKAGFGGGIGVLAVPLLALVMSPHNMLGFLLPILILADILSNLHHWGHYDWSRLRPLLFGAVIGVGVGTVILAALDGKPPSALNQILGLTIGCICLAVVVMQCYRLTGRELPTLPTHPISGISVGLFAAAVSTISHAAGPIVTIYFLQEKLPKRLMVGSLLIYFLIINSVKVPSLVYYGYLTPRMLLDAAWFMPILPVGTLLGAYLHKKVPEKPFAVIMYVGASASAAYMIYKALA